MNLFPVAKKVRRPSILVVLAALALTWAGGSPVMAGEPVPSLVAPDFETFLAGAECDVPPGDAAALPEPFPAPQPKSGSVTCSPYCGTPMCRGELMGEYCVTSTGAAGTCYGPYLGRQCIDGLPWCYCA